MTTRELLTAATSLGDWLDHPVGGPIIREVFEGAGVDSERLGPARVFPLGRLVALSQGQVSQELVDDVVRAANDGELVVESETVDLVSLRAPRPVRQGLTLSDIQIRDPFLLRDDERDAYLLYGSTDPNIWDGPGIGFDAYRSTDLETWEGPVAAFRPQEGFWAEGQFWAPEVHAYRGRWYMFATFSAPDGYRGTQVLVADGPEGPFLPWSDGAVTPRDWQCLDGTLFVDDSGEPWIVYCHEWTQIGDGAVVAQRLSDDLTAVQGEPIVLFHATEAPWSTPVRGVQADGPVHVTDGPFLLRVADGHLAMLWSSHGEDGYAMGVAHSQTGLITGPWTQEDHALWPSDGGHGMILRLPDGQLLLTLHQPNETPRERAVLVPVVERDGTIEVVR